MELSHQKSLLLLAYHRKRLALLWFNRRQALRIQPMIHHMVLC